MERLPHEFKYLWIAALRSGKYKQAQGVLKSDTGFCCLGVACDLADPQTWRRMEHYDEETGQSFECDDAWVTAAGNDELPDKPDLPEEVFKALDEDRGDFRVMDKLAEMNDHGKTFAELADWIEEHL